MKFLFITATPLDPIQGSGTYVGIATLKSALERAGHSVQLLAPQRSVCPNYVLKRYWFNRTLPPRINRQIQGKPFHAVIGFDCDGFYWGRFRERHPNLFSIPYIVSIKGVLADEAKQEKGIVQKLLQIQAGWEIQNVSLADRVFATSRYSQRMIEQNYRIAGDKIQILPELIHIPAWNTLLSNAVLRKDKKGIIILTVCRMYPRKNLGLLLHAWKNVIRKEPSSQLRIVGSGQEYSRWSGLARRLSLGDSVFFLGDRTREQLAEEYKNCDLFCLPSRQEGFGIVFLEAMVAGKPIIATTAGAIPEVVHPNEHGILINPDSESELTWALIQMIRSQSLRQQLGSRGREWVKQFDSLEIAQKFIAQVLQEKGIKEQAPKD